MKPIKIILTIFMALSVFACGQQEGGLFYSLEQEAAIYNGTLPNDITIGSMAKKAGVTPDAGYYFIAAGKFMYIAENAADTVEWTAKNPEAHSEYLCYNMTKIADTIYAVFYSIDGASVKLFSIDVSAPATSMTWSSELSFSGIPDGETVIDLEQAGTKLFVYTQNLSNQYSVFSADLAGFTTAAVFTPIAEDLNAGGELKADFDGTNYWIVAGNRVFLSDGATAGTDKTPGTAVSSHLTGKGFGGIVCAETDAAAAGTEVFLTSEEGVMLKYINSAWVVLSSPYDEENGLFEPLNDIEHIQISNGDDIVNVIIAGSEAGYYEMQISSPDSFVSAEKINTSLTTYNQFSSIELSENIILDFYFDDEADDEKVFALCYNGGLWQNSFKENSYRFWDIE